MKAEIVNIKKNCALQRTIEHQHLQLDALLTMAPADSMANNDDDDSNSNSEFSDSV